MTTTKQNLVMAQEGYDMIRDEIAALNHSWVNGNLTYEEYSVTHKYLVTELKEQKEMMDRLEAA